MKVLFVLLLVACGPTQSATIYSGIPEGAMPVCSWNILHKDTGECVADSKRFHCIKRSVRDEEHYWDEISCAPKTINPVYDILEGWSKR